jgi:phosphatidylinositol kinase/protein kinase (PI-3  family)
LGFETAAFKLSHEMVELMDGRDSELFATFKQITVRAFLEARKHASELETLIAAYADSGLPSFQLKSDILLKLHQRFFVEKSDSDAARSFEALVDDAADKWTTRAYDYVQLLQNNIKY